MPTQLAGDVVLTRGLTTLWNAAISNRTRLTYSVGFNCFIKFLIMYQLIVSPITCMPFVDEIRLMFFVSYCFTTLQLKHGTVKTYLAGIKYQYMAGGVHTLFDESGYGSLNRLQTILRGYKKLQMPSPIIRLPIVYSMLHDMVHALQSGIFGPFADLVIETMCTVAFFGFLRVSEFTCTGCFNSDINLCIKDITVCENDKAVYIILKVSKTDPFRQGVVISLFASQQMVCPYRAISKLLMVRKRCGATPLDPIFVDSDGKCFNRPLFLSKIRTVLTRIGVDDKLYNTHSFRIGAATTAGSVRMEPHLIKTLGRWNSDCYIRYIRTPKAELRDAQNALCYK